MLSEPLVTVILTSFNHAAFIEESLESVLRQSLSEIEVFVIDDASSDDTCDRVLNVRDPRIQVVRNAHNRGRHLRNWAMRQARGTFIAFQNSDDVWFEDKLAAQVEFLLSNPRHGACFTAVELRDDSGSPCPDHPIYGGLFRVESHDRFGWLRRFFLQGNCVALPSAVIRADVVARIGLFDPALFQVGDFDLWVRIASASELAVMPEALTAVRVQSDGRNVSAPSPAADNRTRREAVEVLCRYGQNPILKDVGRIFELDTNSSESDVSRLAELGIYASGLELRHQRVAGARLLMQALRSDESQRALSEEERSRIALHLFRTSGDLEF